MEIIRSAHNRCDLMSTLFSLQDWIIMTTSIFAAMLPAMAYLKNMSETITKFTTIVAMCPTCNRMTDPEHERIWEEIIAQQENLRAQQLKEDEQWRVRDK